MHTIEPYHSWQKYYRADRDVRSPFFGREYGQTYVNDVYGYFIDPEWDEFGSETLYCKLLYVDYGLSCCIIELIGEWNDTLHNDIMHFKRNVIDKLIRNGVKKFVLIAENLFQFHGGDTDYYEEWFDEIEDGWIAGINLRKFIEEEMMKYHIDYYINIGGTMHLSKWRTLKPDKFFLLIDTLMTRRLGA